MHLAALIRWCIRMKIVRSGRVNFDFLKEFPIRQPSVEDSLGCGTPANIAHANKKNSVFEDRSFFKLVEITL